MVGNLVQSAKAFVSTGQHKFFSGAHRDVAWFVLSTTHVERTTRFGSTTREQCTLEQVTRNGLHNGIVACFTQLQFGIDRPHIRLLWHQNCCYDLSIVLLHTRNPTAAAIDNKRCSPLHHRMFAGAQSPLFAATYAYSSGSPATSAAIGIGATALAIQLLKHSFVPAHCVLLWVVIQPLSKGQHCPAMRMFNDSHCGSQGCMLAVGIVCSLSSLHSSAPPCIA